jgi:O-antigen ligase
MGSFCMLSYPVLIWKYRRCDFLKKWMVVTLATILVYLHLLTGSRGSLVISIFGICVWFMVLRKKVTLMLLLGMISVAVFFVVQLKPASFEREEDSKNLTDLNGRPEFWYGSYMLIMERPILGYGYGVEGKIWSDPRFNKPEYSLWRGSARTSLHNGYLSIAVGVGIVGFVVWCITLLIPLWRCRLLPYSDYKAFVMSITSMCLILDFIESELTGGNSIGAAFFWITWVIAGRLSQQYEVGRRFTKILLRK